MPGIKLRVTWFSARAKRHSADRSQEGEPQEKTCLTSDSLHVQRSRSERRPNRQFPAGAAAPSRPSGHTGPRRSKAWRFRQTRSAASDRTACARKMAAIASCILRGRPSGCPPLRALKVPPESAPPTASRSCSPSVRTVQMTGCRTIVAPVHPIRNLRQRDVQGRLPVETRIADVGDHADYLARSIARCRIEALADGDEFADGIGIHLLPVSASPWRDSPAPRPLHSRRLRR